MKTNILFKISLTIFFYSIFSYAQKVSNISFVQEQSNIIVSYDLETKIPCKIALFVSTNGGSTWQGPLKKVSGDIAANVSSGNKLITWNVLEEFEELRGDKIMFQVRAGAEVTNSDIMNKDALIVIKNHIDAIGGEIALMNVKTLLVKAKATIQGRSLDLVSKKSNRGMSTTDISMDGMSIMKQVIGDKSGYQSSQGQRKNIEGLELVLMKLDAIPFVELGLLNDKTIQFIGIESLKGKDVNVVKVGTDKYFYDVKTRLRVAIEQEYLEGAKKLKSMTYYDDYNYVKGIKFPYKTISYLGTTLEFITQDVKINEGINEDDFK